MNKERKLKVKKSIITTLLLQIIVLVCGLIVPRELLKAFGSEAYGATTSIAQFLSYITLLEGGIGAVARSALYKPLAENDIKRISIIVKEIKRFFRIVAYISIGYVLVLACTFKYISHIECYDWMTTFWLVLAIAISTLGQYFIGISYSALIQADQRVYIVNLLSLITTILNALVVIFLIKIGGSLPFIKLASSIVFLIKPTAMWLYVKKRYKLINLPEREKNALSQKWTGFGQHIAYYIHSNTDVSILTLLDNLKSVSVYSVYNMVTHNIQNVISALCSGMESLYGDMIAREEREQLNKTFNFYETMISVVCSILFSVVFVMIVPFVSIYTRDIVDANYIQPIFAAILASGSAVYCLRFPYLSIITAAGHFRQTKWGAYGEAIINIAISIILVWKMGLIGVAIGTVVAIVFRLVYSVIYLSKHIMCRRVSIFVKRSLVNVMTIICICFIGNHFICGKAISNYIEWTVNAGIVFLGSLGITILVNLIFYKENMIKFLRKLLVHR